MPANKSYKFISLGVAAILLEAMVQAQTQITVLPVPIWSQATMGIGSGSYAPAWNEYGVQLPDFPVTLAMPLPWSANPDSCNGHSSGDRSFVTGLMGCGAGQNRAGTGATYRMNVYTDAVPGSTVRVKIQADFSMNWIGLGQEGTSGFYFYASAGENVGAKVDRMEVSYIVNGSSSNSGQWTAAVQTPVSSAYSVGGKPYYKLGMVEAIGGVGLWNVNTSAGYRSEINGITANYIGKVLIKLPEGDAQTRRVTELLPKGLNVRVVDGETGVPFPNEPITFSASGPSVGQLSLTNTITDLNGFATTYFTLGSAVGTYHVTATCPGCAAGLKTVEFTAKAVDKELTCVNCRFSGSPGQPLNNPFELKVIDKLTGELVPNIPVIYNVISFMDRNNNTSSNLHGAGPSPYETITEPSGLSHYSLTLGSEEGTYIVRARCETCLSGQEQIARGTAKAYNITTEAEGNAGGDPGGDCGSGCCPITPVLRMKMVTLPNDRVSFTSAGNENLIGLNATVLPVCLNDSVNVIWQVGDDPGDYIDSGTPVQPAPGPASSFRVENFPNDPTKGLPAATAGRPLPLAYKVTAHIIRNGVMTKVEAKAQQDEIDKCRQEYIDFGIPLTDVSRSRFTVGVGIDPEMVKYKDCFAHIYPSRAQEARDLVAKFSGVKVTSGYRSPRRNWDIYKDRDPTAKAVKTSWHMFGRAVDLDFLPHSAKNWEDLWKAAGKPKILEANQGVPMIGVKADGTEWTAERYVNYLLKDIHDLGYCLHLGE